MFRTPEAFDMILIVVSKMTCWLVAWFSQVCTGSINTLCIGFWSWHIWMETGQTRAKASRMTRMDCGMLAHTIPFPMTPLSAVVVALAVAIPDPGLAVHDCPNAVETGDNDELELHCQVSNELD